MKRRTTPSPKRRIAPPGTWSPQKLEDAAAKATYGGNPEHKRAPSDFGLTPPAAPRPGKTLCDGRRAIPRQEAADLLRAGLRRGLVSDRSRGGWPVLVWSVSRDGEVFEARLENEARGTYHGYPMLSDDPFRDEVLKAWARQ